MNVGKATLGDFHALGIFDLEQLAQLDPTDLYYKMCQMTNSHQDPCVWDVFAATIHEARTKEAYAWWHFTKLRKSQSLKLTYP